MFTFSDEENLPVSEEESQTESNRENSITFKPGNDTKKCMCGVERVNREEPQSTESLGEL